MSIFEANGAFNTIYQFIKPSLSNKLSIFEEYGVFKKLIVRKNYLESSPGKGIKYN